MFMAASRQRSSFSYSGTSVFESSKKAVFVRVNKRLTYQDAGEPLLLHAFRRSASDSARWIGPPPSPEGGKVCPSVCVPLVPLLCPWQSVSRVFAR